MFTGIVEEIGQVRRVIAGMNSAILEIEGKKVLEDMKLGDSIAVNGVCLTVTHFQKESFMADVMHETMDRSTLGSLQMGSLVNLERAMSANGRFGGHMVSGHIDGMGEIIEIEKDDTAIWYTIGASEGILRYIVEKGSITLDGISLTVAKVQKDSFAVSIIPHTQKETILYTRKKGDSINIENDLVGKYIEKFVGEKEETSQKRNGKPPNVITWAYLSEHGF